jgi:hypothetical protein
MVPPGEAHYTFNDGKEEVEVEVKLQPAREGFEKGLCIVYWLARNGSELLRVTRIRMALN